MASESVGRWTAEEDEILQRECQQHIAAQDSIDWTAVAMHLPNRSNKDCRKRWMNHGIGGLKKGSWNAQEDAALRQAVEAHGTSWAKVAQHVENRSADQCAKRWSHYLDPRLDRSEWTQEENKILMRAIKEYGRKWQEIRMNVFPKRSTNDIKNQFTVISQRKSRGAVEDDFRLWSPSTSQSSKQSKSSSEPSYNNAIGTTASDQMPMHALDNIEMNDFAGFNNDLTLDTGVSAAEFLNFPMDATPRSLDDFGTNASSASYGFGNPQDWHDDNATTNLHALQTTQSQGLSKEGTLGMPLIGPSDSNDIDPMLMQIDSNGAKAANPFLSRHGSESPNQTQTPATETEVRPPKRKATSLSCAVETIGGSGFEAANTDATDGPALRVMVPSPSSQLVNDLMGVIMNHKSPASIHLEK